ncbi:MAG: tetratricopeptide repeat protein [Opitutaceae bacterium]
MRDVKALGSERAATPARRVWWAAALMAGAAVVAYWNTFSAPFIFDDIPSIVQNPKIRDLSALGEVLLPSRVNGAGVEGRPIVQLSLAINYALGGENVFSYHALNLLIHLGAGLALFGIVSRTLRSPVLARQFGASWFWLAWAIALLWMLHPLQTESVTCVVQRTESLMGLFYLLTLYAFIRSVESPTPGRWHALSWLACALGMAIKEVMVSAPLMVLLYDRTFVAGSFAEAWRRRGRVFLALATTWVLLVSLMAMSAQRGGTVGFGRGVAWWEYAFTQCRALAIYLKLSLWPHPLVLDYGIGIERDVLAVLPQGMLVLALAGATGWALWRRPVVGFIGAWFFAILAPSSSVVPLVTQTMAEHRMYLPVASVIALGVGALHFTTGRAARGLVPVTAMAFGAVTFLRNTDFRTAENIWHDTIAKQPRNERAYYGLAVICDEQGRVAEAIGHYETAVRLKPSYANAHANLAHNLMKVSRLAEATRHYREYARLEPTLADPHIHLGFLFAGQGRWEDAIAEYQAVLRLTPKSSEDHFNLAQVYLHAGKPAEAVEHFEVSLRLKPDRAETYYRLGDARRQAGQLELAATAYMNAVRLDPNLYAAQINLGGVLLLLGRGSEAVAAYEKALRLRPDDPAARSNLERARALTPGIRRD